MPTPEDDVLETVLVHCWESALRRGPIDVHDNFFAIGGHSLAAMKIATGGGRSSASRCPTCWCWRV